MFLAFNPPATRGVRPTNIWDTVRFKVRFFYRFKADYFRMGMFFDPAPMLLGKDYRWKADDLNNSDQRLSENFFFEIGVDFGHIGLFLINSHVNYAIKDGHGLFYRQSIDFLKYGIEYQNHLFIWQLLHGKSDVFDEFEESQDFFYSSPSSKHNFHSL